MYATIGGGYSNAISGNSATIAGGNDNSASGQYASIAGGYSNFASGASSSIGGGNDNTNSGQNSTIGGGYSNSLSGNSATIAGGNDNAQTPIIRQLQAGMDSHFRPLQPVHLGIMALSGGNTTTITSSNLHTWVMSISGWAMHRGQAGSELRLYEAQNSSGAFPASTIELET